VIKNFARSIWTGRYAPITTTVLLLAGIAAAAGARYPTAVNVAHYVVTGQPWWT